MIFNYSEPPSTRPSGIQMVIFWTLFVSGFRMVLAVNLFFTIQKPDKKSGFRMVEPFESWTEVFLSSSLDRFIIKYFLFMTAY
jgi:hypothetical protein